MDFHKIDSEWKLKFCPACIGRAGAEYDYKTPLDADSLGYQLLVVTPENDINTILSGTVLAGQYTSLIKREEDSILNMYYNGSNKIYYLSNKEMRQVVDIIEGHGVGTVKNPPSIIDANEAPDLDDTDEDDALEFTNELTCNLINRGNKTGIIEILKNGIKIFELYPCCPVCHVILPLGWFYAQHYIDIGLVSPTYGGKTTLLTTHFCRDLIDLNNNEKKYNFESANYADKELEPEFIELRDEAIAMKRGQVPGGTQKAKGKRKVFLYGRDDKGQTFIVGINDISGEILAIMGNHDRESRTKSPHADGYKHCDGYVYLVEPDMIEKYVQYAPREEEESDIKKEEVKTDVRLMDISEQGEYQKKNKELNAMEERTDSDTAAAAEAEVSDPFAMYRILKDEIRRITYDTSSRGFAFTLTKADLLKDFLQKKEREKYQEFQALFIPNERIRASGPEYKAALRDQESELLEYLLDELYLNDIKRSFPECTFHVISPLGRKPTKEGGVYWMKRTNEYNDVRPHPIRIADPFISCISTALKAQEEKTQEMNDDWI